MSDGTALETDPSVCYRHPGRQSWVLCQRCGRTVCPECQILAPVGVHCPECVKETSGGVSWRPANNVTPLAKPKRRRRPAGSGRARSMLAGWGGASGAPASQAVLIGYAALFLVGMLTGSAFVGGAPFQLLSGQPGTGWQVWRFLTAPLSYPAAVDILTILFAALSAVFWWLTAPQLERMLGTRRFLGVAATASVIGTAGTMLSGGYAYGLTAPLFGLFAALLVEVWDQPQLRVQILVMTGINLLISLSFGGSGLPMLVGGMVGGAGSLWLIRTAPSRGWKPRTPVLITAGVCVLLVLLTILRG